MLALIAAVASVASTHAWRTYANERFAFSMCYPADIFRQKGNTYDGATFRATDGSELSMFGKYDVNGLKAQGEIMQEVLERRASGATVKYHVGGQGWAVVSGFDGDKVFYQKAIDSGDRVLQFAITYPIARNPFYRPVVERLTACLKQSSAAF